MPPKKLTGRAKRRELERGARRLARDLDRLARLEPGGAPERPVEIDSPAEVEVRARSTRCPLCGGALRVEEHTAETVGAARLRVAHVACSACGARRALYYQLRAPS